MTACVVCQQEPEAPVSCACGAVYCRDCQDGHECAPSPTLFDDQTAFVDGIRDMVRKGHRRVLAVAPTGFGKRFVQCWLAKQASDKQKKALFYVNRRILVQQFADELRRFGISFNMLMGAETTPDNGEPVCAASLATLKRRHFFTPEGMPSGNGLPPAMLILGDESHLESEAQRMLFSFYPDAVIIGCTATPVGKSGKALTDVWPTMFIGPSKAQLIKSGRLVPTKMYAPGEPDMRGVRIVNGNYASGEAEERVRQCIIFANVFKAWEPWNDKLTVVFAPGVEFAQWLAKEWRRRGYTSACVDAKTPLAERERIFKAVKDGEIRVLLSVDVLKVGFDLPELECGIDLQPTCQLRDFIQKTGRVCRARPGKHEAVWIDINGSYWKFGHPDEDVAWDELKGDETTADLISRRRKKAEQPEPRCCLRCTFAPLYGSKCPQCGFEIPKPTRIVWMLDGKVKHMAPPRPKDKKAPSDRGSFEWQAKNWKSALYAAAGANQTVAQAKHHYKSKTGELPPFGLPDMPAAGAPEWGWKVRHLFPYMAREKRVKA